MAGPVIEWTDPGPNAIPTTTPVTGDMPDLTDETAPAADDGSPQRVSQANELRDVVIANRTKLLEVVTAAPRGVWVSGTQVNFAARQGQPATVKNVLQDGIYRSFTGILNWDDANGVGNLGWDEAASQAAGDKWIQFYAVDDGSGGLTIKASDNPVSVGPAGGVAFKHVWSTYRSGGNLVYVFQSSNNFFRAGEITVYNLLSQANEASFVLVDLSAFVPVEADHLYAHGRIRGASGEDWIHRFSYNGTNTILYARDRFDGSNYYPADVSIPISVAQTIWRRIAYLGGGGATTANTSSLYFRGWRSATIEP